MAPKTGPQNCPQCGTPTSSARTLGGRTYCGRCRQQLIFCHVCGGVNLAWSDFCHNCGKRIEKEPVIRSPELASSPPPVKPRPTEQVAIERMHLCTSCKKTIGEGEPFCSYCGAKQAVPVAEGQAQLDPHTMKAAVTMLARITEAKDHPEYSAIDELTTTIGEVALGNEKPRDALELSFTDQLRLLTLVFEYTRDKVSYKGETFGEHIRWSWETLKTGGDCDCKVVLLATMLASLAFRRMHLLVLPPGKYLNTRSSGETSMQGHVMLEVELYDKSRLVRVNLDPSCPDCDVDEIPEAVQPFLQNFYRIPVVP